MNYYLTILSLLVFLKSTVHAQEKRPLIEEQHFTNEVTLGINSNTSSTLLSGFTFKYGRELKENQNFVLGIELTNVKNHKEEKFATIATGNSFIPGKINHLYALRTQAGKEYKLFGAYPEDGIRLTAVFMGGLTFGVLKPYYIEYAYLNKGILTSKFEAYDPKTHQLSRVLDKGGFSYGWGDLSLNMGLNAKAALNFELGKGELYETISGVEIGFNIEYYPKAPQIFAVEKIQHLYTSLSVILYLGKRY